MKEEEVEEDLYSLLNVSKRASGDEIKAQFKTLARILHPDKSQNNEESDKLFLKISFAYKVLSNPIQRIIYDEAGMLGIKAYQKEIDELEQFKNINNANESKELELQLTEYDELQENIRDRVLGRIALDEIMTNIRDYENQTVIKTGFDLSDEQRSDSFNMRDIQVNQKLTLPLTKSTSFSFSTTAYALSVLKQVQNSQQDLLFPQLDVLQKPSKEIDTHGIGNLSLSLTSSLSSLTKVTNEVNINSTTKPTYECGIERVLSPIMTSSILFQATGSTTGLNCQVSRKLFQTSNSELELEFNLGQGSLSGTSLGLNHSSAWREKEKSSGEVIGRVLKSSLELTLQDGFKPGISLSHHRMFAYNSMFQTVPLKSLNKGYLLPDNEEKDSNIYWWLERFLNFFRGLNFLYLPNLFNLFDSFHSASQQQLINRDVGQSSHRVSFTTVYSNMLNFTLSGVTYETGLERKSILRDYGFSFALSLVQGLTLNLKLRHSSLYLVVPFRILSTKQLISYVTTFQIVNLQPSLTPSLSVAQILSAMALGYLFELSITPLLSYANKRLDNYWQDKENELRLERNRAIEQLKVMASVVDKNIVEYSELNIISARYGTQLHISYSLEKLPRLHEKSTSYLDFQPRGGRFLSNQEKSIRVRDEGYEVVLRHPKNLDVSQQLQFLCLKSRTLKLSHKTKSGLMGFYNPIKLQKESIPKLYIKYSYHGKVYERTWTDEEPVLLPCPRAPVVGYI